MRERLGAVFSATRIVFVALFVSSCVVTTMGQLAGKGTVQGTVADQSGAVVPGASVTARNVATNTELTREASQSGDYSIPLDPGVYVITASAKGFKTVSQLNVNVNAMETVTVNLALIVGSTGERVEVTATVAQLDTATAQLTATMEQEVYSSLPVPQAGTQRRATDFVQYMPGVNAQPTNGGLDTNTGVVNGSGSRGSVSSVYIEGVPLMNVAGQGDPRFIWTAIPMEAVNQFEVTTVGYAATYEGQGVLNYDIKRGSNNFHGSAYEFFRNTALDTWGYMASVPVKNPVTGQYEKQKKQQEHQNEYGGSAGGAIIKDKLFVFGAFEGYKLRQAANLQYQTNPTAAMMNGDFSSFLKTSNGVTTGIIYDPATTTCTSSVCKRTPFPGNIIPKDRIVPQALAMQQFVPPGLGDTVGAYLGGLPTGRNNWMNTERVDFNLNPKHSISGVFALGKQATLGGPGTGGGGYTGALASNTNQAPAPLGSSQDFSVRTTVIVLEDNYIFNPHVINQVKLAFGRYSSTGTTRSIGDGWGAADLGITGLPAGQAQDSFPTVTFSGNGLGINRWAGYSSNRNTANGTIFSDNVQWQKGKHSLTIGGQIAWMQYNWLNNATGVNPLQLTFSSNETAGYVANKTSLDTISGNSYASFLLGATNPATFTLSSAPETGARYRAISPYIQDNWRVTSKLTLNLGLRWDYYPAYLEAQDRLSWMDPQKMNTLINYPGALSFAGDGDPKCNCRTNVKNYWKNFGPRLGFAYAASPRTVVRGSWGVMYTHGNNVSGSATARQGSGLLGYAASPRTTSTAPTPGQTGTALWYLNQPFPAYTNPPFLDPTLGTYYTTASSAASQTVNYADPYVGGRAPEYINWSLGLQRQLTTSTSMTATYVGSQGHFTNLDALNARGIYSNQLDPKWLYLGGQLSNKATAANLALAGITAPFPTFSSSTGTIAQALRPFPQYNGVADVLGYVGNTNYNALEAILQRRMSKGLLLMATYTWSKSIDNAGTFRSGYDIPAQYASDGQFHKARSLDRSLSLSDIPHRGVVTAVYALPFGRGHLGGDNPLVRALGSDWKISSIFTIQSGTPLGLLLQNCQTNPSIPSSTCQPFLNPGFTGDILTYGGYTHFPADQLQKTSFINRNAFSNTSDLNLRALSYDYMFSTLARTAPLGLRNSGNYNVDLSLKRGFKLNERFGLDFQVDAYNLTNHTRIGFANNAQIINLPSTSASPFGAAGVMNTSRYMQLSARVNF